MIDLFSICLCSISTAFQTLHEATNVYNKFFFAGDLNANTRRDTFFSLIQISWLKICLLFFGVVLCVLIILHLIVHVSIVNFVKMKRRSIEDEIF